MQVPVDEHQKLRLHDLQEDMVDFSLSLDCMRVGGCTGPSGRRAASAMNEDASLLIETSVHLSMTAW